MKKNLLALAITAGLGAMGTAHAVSVNPDGLGQALIFPYYTTQAGYDTNVHLVNTTNAVKAVKVRFLEAKNSQEVLDFNLFLSPHDEWTGSIVRTDTGAKLITTDKSCTAPAIPATGAEFRPYQFSGDSANTAARTREGYLEVIEMGEVTDPTLISAITHVNGVPGSCSAVIAASTGNPVSIAPKGGLYGYGTLVNVQGGTDITYDAVALDAFSTIGLYTEPGSTNPSLNSADEVANLFDGTNVITDTFNNGADAVSAVLMADAIANDYVTDAAIGAQTDWVITFPTKRFYVNVDPALAPFLNSWNKSTSQSCQPISIVSYDREERTQTAGIDFSPLPPTQVMGLCYEANVLSINGSNVLGSVEAHNNVNLDFVDGWMGIGFDDPAYVLTGNGYTYQGLPVVGFNAIAFTNGDIGGLLSNYAGNTNHKAMRDIAPITP